MPRRGQPAATGPTRCPPPPAFTDRLEPLNRILDLSREGWAVWCCSPIYGPDGKVHVFFTRTPQRIETWLFHGEIAHATADHPAGPYTVHGTVIRGRGKDYWDSHGLINACVYHVDGKYALFYFGIGDPNIHEDVRRGYGTGLCVSDDLWNWSYANNGQRVLGPSEDPDAWDYWRGDNPSLIKHPVTGEYWLYYTGSVPRKQGMRDSIGLARSRTLEGPYERMFDHPLIDARKFTQRHTGGPIRGFEDSHVWIEDGSFHMLLHDMGYDPVENGGLYFQSEDGIHWGEPSQGYPGPGLWHETGRVETPLMLLDCSGRSEYLFVNRDTAGIASGFVFRVRPPG